MTTTNRQYDEASASITAQAVLSAGYDANVGRIVLRGYHELSPVLLIQMGAGQARTLAHDLWTAADAATPNDVATPDSNHQTTVVVRYDPDLASEATVTYNQDGLPVITFGPTQPTDTYDAFLLHLLRSLVAPPAGSAI